jgi:glucokinase
MPQYAVGIDIGGTNIKTVAASLEGSILSRRTMPTGTGRSEWTDSLRESLAEIKCDLGAEPFGIAVAAPGLPARDGRSIAWMRGRLEELEGLDWQERLGTQSSIRVTNDAQAAVHGEAWIGAAAGFENVLMLTLGTGVGGGAIVDGRVLRGHLGRAGHVGHISLNVDGSPDIVGTPGSLEDVIGDCTVAARSNGLYTTSRELVAAFEAGESEAILTWMRSVRCLAAGLVSLINVLDPEIIVIGGGIAAAGDSLFGPLAAELDRIEWRPNSLPVKLVKAQLGEWAGAVGAGRLAWQVEGTIC